MLHQPCLDNSCLASYLSDHGVTVHRSCLKHVHLIALWRGEHKPFELRNQRLSHLRHPEGRNHFDRLPDVNVNVPVLDDFVHVTVLGQVNNNNGKVGSNSEKDSIQDDDGNCDNVNILILLDSVNVSALCGQVNINNSELRGSGQDDTVAFTKSFDFVVGASILGWKDDVTRVVSLVNVPVLDGVVNDAVLGQVNNEERRNGETAQ